MGCMNNESDITARLDTHSYNDDDIKKIHEEFCTRFPILREIDGDVQKVKHVIRGLVQQGKSQMTLALIWICFYVYKHTVVLVVMNMVGSMNKWITQDIPEFNRDSLLHSYPLVADTVQRFEKQILRSHGSNVNGNSGRIPVLVAMCNHSQIASLRRCLARFAHDTTNVSLVIDEGDQAVKNLNDEMDKTKFGPEFTALRKLSHQLTYVSATPFANLNQMDKDGFKCRVLHMDDPPAGYQGFKDFRYLMPFTEDECKKVRDGHDFSPLVPRIKYMIHQYISSSKYKVILVNASQETMIQDQIARFLAKQFGVFVFVMNSKGGGYIPKFFRTKNGSVFVQDTKYKYPNELFDYFEIRNTSGKQKLYIIVSGQYASRSVPFRPSRGKGTGGLDAMILLPSPTSHAAATHQYTRLCGVYPESDLKKIMFTTESTRRKMIAESINYRKMFDAIGSQPISDARASLEDMELFDVGRGGHDRKAVDDTFLYGRHRTSAHVFASIDEIERTLGVRRADFIWMTNPEVRVVELHPNDPVIGFVKAGIKPGDIKLKGRIRNRIIDVANLSSLNGSGARFSKLLQMVWNETRYYDLHDVTRKFNGNGNYVSKYVAEVMPDGKVRIVEWKDQFVSSTRLLDDHRLWVKSKVFVNRSTRGKYHVYATNDDMGDIKFGTLKHR